MQNRGGACDDARGRIQSIPGALVDVDQLDQQRDSDRRVESSTHSLQAEHARKNPKILQNSKDTSPRGQAQNDRGRDSKGGSASEQRKSAITSVK